MKIKEKIFAKQFDGEQRIIRFSDFNVELKPDDIIEIHREEAFYSENNSHDGYTLIEIYREREQTKEEKEEFVNHLKELAKKREIERYQEYLKLKEEFEDGKKNIELLEREIKKCPICSGSGYENIDTREKCTFCKGEGYKN